MAKPLAYRLYRDGLATMHVSNDAQELVDKAKQLSTIFGQHYQVKDLFGNVVWESEGDGE